MHFYMLAMRAARSNSSEKLGMSEVLNEGSDDSVVSIMDVHGKEELLWDDKTVSTHWEYDERDNDFEFIELDQSFVQDA